MADPDLLALAGGMADERLWPTESAPSAALRAYARSDEGVARALELIASETSAYRLGEVLRWDIALDLPIPVVKATYERLFELGAEDVYTRMCYARYLLLHGPDWDEVAQGILDEIEPTARLAGLWDSPVTGHHPVFYRGEP